MTVQEQSNKLIIEIKKRARAFVNDNYNNPLEQDYQLIENAMLIGAVVQMEMETLNK